MASRSKFLHRYRRRLMCPCCRPEDDLRRWLKRRRRREGMTENGLTDQPARWCRTAGRLMESEMAMVTRYGVFQWSRHGLYAVHQALRYYKRESDAQQMADQLNGDAAKANYVVRPVRLRPPGCGLMP